MYIISDSQIDFIVEDIRKRGITIGSLQDNLLDHICILIEQNLVEGGDFEGYYTSVIRSFYRQEMRELEEETLFLLNFKKGVAVLSRMQFFCLLFAILIGPFITYDLFWYLSNATKSNYTWPREVWVSTFILALHPLLVLLILFLTPERYDPLIPRKSKIVVGLNPLVRVFPA